MSFHPWIPRIWDFRSEFSDSDIRPITSIMHFRLNDETVTDFKVSEMHIGSKSTVMSVRATKNGANLILNDLAPKIRWIF